MIFPSSKQGYKFFHDGTLALSKVESNGIRIDLEYLAIAMDETATKIKEKEHELKNDKVYTSWHKRYGDSSNLGSDQQLGTVLEELGYKSSEKTPTGRVKWDETALDSIDLPFVKVFVQRKKLIKVLNTYLKGIKRETVDGLLHPSFNLAGGLEDGRKGGALSYRGSSSNPNFQNMPIRNKMMGSIIRKCFISRRNYYLAEIDFSTIEVRIAACVTKDPVLIDYVKDKSKDMHRDRAGEIFLLSDEYLIKEKDWAKKTVRDCSKNKFVFPQFYGSYYYDCALAMWEAMERSNYTMPEGMTVKEHLAKKGIKGLGEKDPEASPKPGTFIHHVKTVEDKMWNDVFTVYTGWKKRWYQKYLDRGFVTMPTGFIAKGVYRRNQVLNLPIQGPAFHCLLWCIIELQKEFETRGMKSLIVAQIHDCVLVDIHKSEVQLVLDLAHEIMTERLPKAWDWIIVPLETEVDIVPRGLTWKEKAPVRYTTHGWRFAK